MHPVVGPRWAHHDGSERYVRAEGGGSAGVAASAAGGSPFALGSDVTVSVRVDADAGVTSVAVRTVEDGEPRIWPAEVELTEHGETWFAARIRLRNPVTRYRFLLLRPGGYSWLNAAGVHDRDVSDAHDFRLSVHPPAPEWSRFGVFYQIFPDRFARSAAGATAELPGWAVPRDWDAVPAAKAPETPFEFFGGDLRGIAEHLDYLADLGVTGIYLTPIFPAGSNHRYDAASFETVDPLLGGDEALAELSDALHRRGMRLIGDLTTNHTGIGHEWFRTAAADPSSAERGFYFWTDAEAHRDPQPGSYEAWLNVPTLPKLNYRSAELRRRLTTGPDSIVARWLRPPFRLDGWRIDVANMTGRRADDDFTREIARELRATAIDTNPEAVVIAEHFHDATDDVVGDGWHANMNYTGFTRPLWMWLADPGNELPFLGLPTMVPSVPGGAAVAAIDDFLGQISWQVRLAQWNMLGSHDTARIRTVTGSDERMLVAATALMTLPGTPVIFAGDELGGQGINGEHSRTTMPWGREHDTNPHIFSAYRELIALRRSERVLVDGGLRWLLVDDDAIAFSREVADRRAVVVLTRGAYRGSFRLPGAPFSGTGASGAALSSTQAPGAEYSGPEVSGSRDGLSEPGVPRSCDGLSEPGVPRSRVGFVTGEIGVEVSSDDGPSRFAIDARSAGACVLLSD